MWLAGGVWWAAKLCWLTAMSLHTSLRFLKPILYNVTQKSIFRFSLMVLILSSYNFYFFGSHQLLQPSVLWRTLQKLEQSNKQRVDALLQNLKLFTSYVQHKAQRMLSISICHMAHKGSYNCLASELLQL